MRIFNGKYPLSFPLKSCKISNWDFTPSWRLCNNNNFYLNFTEWLASPGGTKFLKPRTTSFYLGLFFSRLGRGNLTPANANNSVLAKNPWRSWIFWAESKSARIFTWEILKMNPMLRYFVFLTLKVASNQLQTSSSNWCQGSHNKLKGTMIRVLVENNFDRDYVCHMAIKVSRSTFTTAMCKCTINTLLDDSNLNAFQTFWPRLNILRLVHVPKIIDDCNFRSADSRVSRSNFSFN